MNRQLGAVVFAALMVTSMFVAPVDLHRASPVDNASAASGDDFAIVDAANNGGSLVVVLEAQASQDVTDFVFYYEQAGNSRVGPMTIGNGDVVGAQYPNGTSFDPSVGINAGDADRTRAIFQFASNTAPFTADRITVNATSNGQTYAGASDAEKDVASVNWQRVTPKASDGTDPSGIVPFLVQNANTNQSYGNTMVNPSSNTMPDSVSIMCRGADAGGTCTDPESGSTATHHTQGWSSGNGGFGTAPSPSWSANAPVALRGYNLATSKMTERVTGSGTVTAKTTVDGAPAWVALSSAASNGGSASFQTLTVTNRSSGNVVHEAVSQARSPVMLKPGTQYEVTFTNSNTYGTETRYLTVPSAGMTMATFLVNKGKATSTVSGQLLNESGDPVANSVVMAERAGSGAMGYRFYNSTTTDENGLFSMRVPESDEFQYPTRYQLTFVSNESDSGTLVYYPTTHDNGGEGYEVRDSQTVLPPMTMKKGGEVAVSLSQSGGGNIQSGMLSTTLGKYTSRTGARSRSAVSSSFNQISFGQNKPTSASVEMMSPTTSASTRVNYNIWGMAGSRPKYVCSNDVSVSQGSTSQSSCAMEQAGYLNLSVQQYRSIVQQSNGDYADFQKGGFFYGNELLIRNDSTNEVLTYLSAGSGQIYNLGTGGPSTNVTIPVPPGDYTLELRPSNDWVRATTVNDSATVSVSAGAEKDVTLDRGGDFRFAPVGGRSGTSFTRSAENTFAVNVTDPVTRTGLTGSQIDATVHFAHRNGTKASSRETLSYNSTAGEGVFDTTTLKPSAMGLSAGTYDMVVTATYTSGDHTYNSTTSVPVQVSDFQTSIGLSSGTVGPGESVLGTISAYDTTTNPPSGVSAANSDVEIELYDENGNLVTSKNPASGVSNGEGTFDLAMPDDVGNYRIVVFADDGNGNQGIAQRLVRVSKYDVSVETGKDVYGATESVTLSVAATNSSDGSAVENASVEVRVNGNTVGGTTGSDGQFNTTLKPSSLAQEGTAWGGDTFVGVEVFKATDSGVFSTRAGTGFEVQQFDVRARPASSSFTGSQNVVLDVSADSSVTVNAVGVTEIDGEPLDSPTLGTQQSGNYYQIDLGIQPAGDHLATVVVQTTGGDRERTRVPYTVRSNSIAADTDKTVYSTGEGITVNATVRDTSGSAVNGANVKATLYAAQSPPLQVGSSVSGTTNSNGRVSLTGLSASSSGPHFVAVEVNGQTRYVSLLVSDLTVAFEDGSDNAVSEYQASPGSTKTVHVDASNGGTPVADGTRVQVGLLAYGEMVDTAGGEVSGGDGDVGLDLAVPDDLSAGTYRLLTRVQTAGGSTGTTSTTFEVSGGNALSLDTDTDAGTYAPGDTASIRSVVTDANGDPVSGKSVVFVLDSEGSASQTLGTVTTGADGEATYDYQIPSGKSNGDYVVRTALESASRTRDYSGFTISSLNVDVSADSSGYTPGETMTLTVEATDAAGSAIDADSGELRIAMPSGNAITQSFSTSGTAPYSVDVTIPDSGSSVGDLTVGARVSKGQSSAKDSTLVTVENGSESASLYVPSSVTAGQSTDVDLQASVGTDATFTVFSPATSSTPVDRSVSLTAGSNVTESVTLSSPGTYVFKLSVPEVGTVTEVVHVAPSASNNPTLTVGDSVGSSSSTFTSSETIYVQSDTAGLTATLVSGSEEYTVPLTQQQGSTYYGTLSTSRSSGVYFVRLDSAQSTGVNETVVEVGA